MRLPSIPKLPGPFLLETQTVRPTCEMFVWFEAFPSSPFVGELFGLRPVSKEEQER